MVKEWIRRLFSRSMRKEEKPWAMLEIQEFEADGRVKMGFDYNDAFVEKVKSLGFQAETDEDTVQLFFLASALRPMSLMAGDEAVQSEAHPQLSSNQNVLMQ